MGEDWNNKCPGNSDEGAPLYAIANGEVVFLDTAETVNGQGKRLYVRYAFPYALGTNGNFTFDSVFLHLQKVSSKVTWTGAGTGSKVTKGQVVAYLGKTGTESAHLHWEAQSNLYVPLGTNPYSSTLKKSEALKYRAPSMIVDDRREELSVSIPSDQTYKEFVMGGYAPFSTAYITYSGQRKTLKNAITAGWITSSAFQWSKSGTWTNWSYSTNDLNTLVHGEKYRIKSVVPNATLSIPIPRNNFQEDRARLDMILAVASDNRFYSINTETYSRNPNWDTSYDLHTMKFKSSSGQTAVAYQSTHKANPLWRYTCYLPPGASAPTAWVPVNPNKLY